MFIANAFSAQMIAGINNGVSMDVRFQPASTEDIAGITASAVGHQDTANVLSKILGREVAVNRVDVKLDDGDSIIIAQVVGGRLPEGCTVLPEGVRIVFLKATVSLAF